jgi:hypothetical protein
VTGGQIDYVYAGGAIEIQRGIEIPREIISEAIRQTNRVFVELSSVVPYVYELLQMRNLSAFVGAAFCQELATSSAGLLRLNPHQDGYPDLLLMDQDGQKHWNELDGQHQQKEPFSPFVLGGIEVKATCGDVPSARALSSQGLYKPGIGDSRIELVTSLNWKAHHRETNYLLALHWDFMDQIPAIAAVMFSNDLDENDWGKIVQPIKGGGRTTSVSIMNRGGVSKLASNPVFVVDDERYRDLLARFSRLR